MHELIAGLLHPVHGADHLLAMAAVGFWGARFGGKARYAPPATFVACMLAGMLAGYGGAGWSGEEAMLAASLLALGLLVAASARFPLAAGCALIGLFAIFHGHAHILELPAGARAAAFGAGVLCATAALHLAGIALALGAARLAGWLPRAAGAAVALAGAWLLVAQAAP
jgi:urease accessory protein